MLSILRTRAVALPGLSSATRFFPVLAPHARALSSSTLRAITSAHVSRQYEDSRGGFDDRYSSPPREFRNTPRPARNDPTSTVWVGNLPYNANATQVETLFAEFGNILSVRLGLSPRGESKGFAHVDFADVASAKATMDANTESQFFLEGRGLYLDYAGPPSTRPAFPPSNTLHFSQYSGDEDSLTAVLKEYVPVMKSLRLMRNPQTGASSRFGFIEFNTVEDATAVLEKFNGKEIAYGEALALAFARGGKPPPRSVDQGGDRYGYGGREREGGFNNRPRGGYDRSGGASRPPSGQPY